MLIIKWNHNISIINIQWTDLAKQGSSSLPGTLSSMKGGSEWPPPPPTLTGTCRLLVVTKIIFRRVIDDDTAGPQRWRTKIKWYFYLTTTSKIMYDEEDISWGLRSATVSVLSRIVLTWCCPWCCLFVDQSAGQMINVSRPHHPPQACSGGYETIFSVSQLGTLLDGDKLFSFRLNFCRL